MLADYKPSDRDIDHWEQYISGLGHPYWVWRKPMPRIDDHLLKCVFYIYVSEDEARSGSTDSATGFFLRVASEYNISWSYLYAVTNWHVLLEISGNPILRINTQKGGYDTIEAVKDDWVLHPEKCDLAIYRIGLDQSFFDVQAFTTDFLLNQDFMDKYNVGVGDDILMIGNFQTRGGTKKNIPTVRFGNISQMPDEPMKNPKTTLPEQSFIVEMRSASGYSGSPVVLSIPWLSNRMFRRKADEDSFPKWHEPEPDYYRLLGINWGHIRTKERLYDGEGKPLPDSESVWINSAMAGVVPSWKLSEMIYSEEEIEIRKKSDEEMKKKIEQSEIVTDFDYGKRKN
jgi:hypothetical protein